MKDILTLYGQLLSIVDAWFSRCITRFSDDIKCQTGCSACCRGLFDITLLDAWYLRTGFDMLDENTRAKVAKKAEERLSSIRSVQPGFTAPYVLNVYPEREWERFMPDDDETPCVLLDDNGRCLVYEHRPMTCRLHGIPLIDTDGEVIDETICSRNSIHEALSSVEIRDDFKNLFADESTCFQIFTQQLFGRRIKELDTIIPAAVVTDLRSFDWKPWSAGVDLKNRYNTVS